MKYIKTFQHITEGLVAKKADKHDMKLAKTKSKVKSCYSHAEGKLKAC